jgi:hypothetical protein
MIQGRLSTLAVVAEVVRLGEKQLERVGHTLVQKLVYLLQEAMGVRLVYQFGMHMHGPYSSDLWGDLTQLRDYEAIRINADPSGYGYRIETGPRLSSVLDRQGPTLTEIRPQIEHLLGLLGGAPVRRLEVLATAHFVGASLKRFGKATDAHTVAERVKALKPHLTIEEVESGYAQLTEIGLAP